MTPSEARSKVADILRWQADFCGRFGSPLYATLLAESAADVLRGGPAWGVLRGREADPVESALALRFMAAVHRLVLEGRAPELAGFYPTAGGDQPPQNAWPVFRSTLESQGRSLRRLTTLPCQTNEVWPVGRAAPGVPRGGQDHGQTPAPAGAGSERRPQPPMGPLPVPGPWSRVGGPPFTGSADRRVRGRSASTGRSPESGRTRGVRSASARPDPGRGPAQADVLGLGRPARAAGEHAGRVRGGGLRSRGVDRARAGPWLEEKLTDRLEDTTTVVFHSVVLQYLDADERLRVFERLHEAGRRATDREPVAWLRFEAGDWRRTSSHEVRLTLWPGGEDRKLAESGPHGRPVRWLGYSA